MSEPSLFGRVAVTRVNYVTQYNTPNECYDDRNVAIKDVILLYFVAL